MMYNFFSDGILDEIVDGLSKSFDELGNEIDNFTCNTWSMKSDVVKSDTGYLITIDLPGVAKEDIKAELSDGSLTVTAKRDAAEPGDDDSAKFVVRERFYGDLKRSFKVGEDVKKEDIKAKFENGVLTLIVPKIVEEKEEDDNSITIE